MKKWIIRKPDPRQAERLAARSDLSLLCAEVLSARGIGDLDSAGAFLSSGGLSDPFLLQDMKEAVRLIGDAAERGDLIGVYGDYDCDGVTSTAMLYSYLEAMGAQAMWYIPEREEGYGLNQEAVRKLAEQGVRLLVTVDNGIAAEKEIQLAKELGMSVVVTDHHQPPETLPPADAVVDPHRRDCPFPFKHLCGAGVVLKLLAALDGGDYTAVLEQFGDIAAIGTVADVVRISGENRSLVQDGLHLLRNTENLGLQALMEVAGVSPERITSTDAAFMLAPRINAAGRFGSPSDAVRLLLSESEEEAQALAQKLDALNRQRKETEKEILQAIDAEAAARPEALLERVLFFAGEGWHPGVIGIAAARVVEKYGKPAFLLSLQGEEARGSARSVEGFSIFEALDACAPCLERYGGHQGAGGFSLSRALIPEFHKSLSEYARKTHPAMPRKALTADKALLPGDLSLEAVKSLAALEPFGEGNPRPLFALLGARVEDLVPLSGGKHTRALVQYGGARVPVLCFGIPPERFPAPKGSGADFLVSLELNTFQGKTSVSIRAADIRRSGLPQSRYFAALDAYEAYRRGEGVPPPLKERVVPVREDLAAVYRALGREEVPVDTLFGQLVQTGMNACKLRLCLDIFGELGLAAYHPAEDTASLIPASRKADLESSHILQELRCL